MDETRNCKCTTIPHMHTTTHMCVRAHTHTHTHTHTHAHTHACTHTCTFARRISNSTRNLKQNLQVLTTPFYNLHILLQVTWCVQNPPAPPSFRAVYTTGPQKLRGLRVHRRGLAFAGHHTEAGMCCQAYK